MPTPQHRERKKRHGDSLDSKEPRSAKGKRNHSPECPSIVDGRKGNGNMTNTIFYENLPEYLKEHGLFCLWKYETRLGKRTKPPYNPHTLKYGDSSDPEAFADLKTAEAAAAGFDGLGVGMFGDLCGIDIDHCIEDGELSEMAADIVLTMDTYTEISPSGEGIRILFLAPGLEYDRGAYYLKNSEKGLEIYLADMTNRYLTVTGNVFNSAGIEDRGDRLQTVLDRYMRREREQAPDYTPAGAPLDLEDEEIVERAMNARNGWKFSHLWNGDIAGYVSHSEADQALCNLLAFWTDRDAPRMDRLFRQSGLYRNEGRARKWDTKRGGATYGEMTIANAIDGCPEGYRPQERAERPQQPANVGTGQVYPYDENDPSNAPVAPRRDSVQLFDEFMRRVQTEEYRPLETGMQTFDRLLGGGITRQSLVVLSAAPGAGKTALASQIFEQFAANGNPVLFLNLEMSREYLLARSLSRSLYRMGYKMTATDVLRGYKWSENQRAHVLEAVANYRQRIAPYLAYNPHGNTSNIRDIKGTLDTIATRHINEGKPPPVVVLDYLHLLSADRMDAQEIVKAGIAMLKDYAIRYNTFVLAIAANNRESNRSGNISQSSARDSSAIEYTADIQLSLNYAALEDGDTKPNSEHKYRADSPQDMDLLMMRNPREMVVRVLKNRMNKPGGKLYMNFDAAHSLFVPVEKNPERYQPEILRI